MHKFRVFVALSRNTPNHLVAAARQAGSTLQIERLNDIRCFLLDMDGTIYLGESLLPGSKLFLNHLDTHRIPFYFITNNSSRSRSDYVKKLHRLGISYGEEIIFSSGEATAIYLKKIKLAARLFVVGTPSFEKELRDFGFDLVQTDPDYVVLGFDTTLTYEKIWKLCDFVRDGKPYVATHSDINCPTETGFMPDIGAIIAMISASTGRTPDVIIGKPHTPIVEAIVEKTGFPVQQLAMVGDRLYTDIALGASGITTILVLSGETHVEDLIDSPYKPDFIFQDLQDLYSKLV